MAKPKIWPIKLYVETEDAGEVDRLAEPVSKLACPIEDFEDHGCRIPWFVIQSESDSEDEETVRDLLNR